MVGCPFFVQAGWQELAIIGKQIFQMATRISLLILLLLPVFCRAQNAQPWAPPATWKAPWIKAPGTAPEKQGLYFFRRKMNLASKPGSYVINISADNRYKLFVNGQMVGVGPSRCIPQHWSFETYDIAPHLKVGANVLAVQVWHYGKPMPVAQHSHLPGLWVQGQTPAEDSASSSQRWAAWSDTAVRFLPVPPNIGHYNAPGGERLVEDIRLKNWRSPDYNDAAWPRAQWSEQPVFRYRFFWEFSRLMEPGLTPAMALTPEPMGRLRLQYSGPKPPGGWPDKAWTISANTTVSVLLDRGYLTTAYAQAAISGGRGSRIKIGYAEALFENAAGSGKDLRQKGHRSKVEGKDFRGLYDEWLPAGGSDIQQWQSLWWKAWRYVKLDITTGPEPMTLHSISSLRSTFPFNRQGQFRSTSDTALARMMEIGWRTAQACANETYMDCPYYEQLQYIGDTRIQAMISLYMAGDDLLMRNALRQLAWTQNNEGMLGARYPSSVPQIIPPFCLWWLGMLHDYHMHRPDTALVNELLPVADRVIDFFGRHEGADGGLEMLPYWNFTDWVHHPRLRFNNGEPPRDKQGHSALLDLQYLMGLHYLRDLHQARGHAPQVAQLEQRIARLKTAIRNRYWDAERGLLASDGSKTRFSQHAQALAVLGNVVEPAQAGPLMQRTLADTSLAPASIYFNYYVHEAAAKAGLADDYLNWLGIWRQQMQLGLTTWAEEPEPSRSDCHAWGASPNINLLRFVLGVRSGAPGFSRILIEPHLGQLKHAEGQVPHPAGLISLKYERKGKNLLAQVTVPAGVPASFEWQGQQRELKSGLNKLELPGR